MKVHESNCELNHESNDYPLTSAQRSIEIIRSFHPDTSFVNIAATVKIRGEIDYTKLNAAINQVLQNNDTFSLRIKNTYLKARQSFANYQIRDFELLDFDHDQGIEDYRQWERKMSKTPFIFYEQPLYYFALVKRKDTEGGFYIKCHHIIADAWSVILLVNQVMAVYASLLHGTEFENINLSYRRHIINEQDYLGSARFTKDRDYWRKTLDKVSEPLLFDNGNNQKLAARRKTDTLTERLSTQVKGFCAQNGVSPFIVITAVLALFFSRTRDKDTIVIGTTVLNRASRKDKNTMGAYFNQLPFVIEINPMLDFMAFLEQLSFQWMDMLRHSSYPYLDILSDYRQTHQVKNKLFDLTFTFLNTTFETEEIDYKIERHFIDEEVNALCIGVDEIDRQGYYNVNYDYWERVLTEEEIIQMHQCLFNLLEQAINNPKEIIGNLSMLSKAQEQRILHEFNAAKMEYPRNQTILHLFRQQVEQLPEQTALIFQDQTLTYMEVDEKSSQLARCLIRKKVGKEEIVGLMVDRSFDLVIGILGILKAKAAYLPIDPAYPLERTQFMLQDARCRFVITNRGQTQDDILSGIERIDLQSTEVWEESKEVLADYPSYSELAYVIYTSGSTGLPKGVMIEHQALVNFVYTMKNQIELVGKTIVAATTISFDIFFLETILPLLIGMKVVITDQEERDDPTVLPALIRKYNIEVLQLTPSKMGIVLKEPSSLRNLSTILLGGEALPEALLHGLKEVTRSKIYNMYGPTETTIWSSIQRVDLRNSVTIGKPIGNTQFYILDQNQRPLPAGMVGEIYISGDGLARGYLYRKELTQERFVPNPFIPGTRMYKTGDLGRWLPNGEIAYMGRNDHQVKLRGFRIELEEIEKQLLRQEKVQQAVVVVTKDHTGKKALCAYLSGDSELSISVLRQYLLQHLPEYMVPNHFIWLTALPLTPNGKIDRKSLPLPCEIEQERDYVAPSNPIEDTLAQIWAEVLGVPKVSVEDDFFVLGGDSLDILQILSETLREKWKLSAQDFYEFPTIQKLAQRILNGNVTDSQQGLQEQRQYPNIREIQPLVANKKFIAGDLLLTGVTGFFGMHVLKELYTHHSGKIYCLVRGENPVRRFSERFKFYFKDIPIQHMLRRVIILQGDVTERRFGLSETEYAALGDRVSSVIHSASLVKHFGTYEEFEKINVNGTQEVIDFCVANQKHLSYISTVSISGNYMSSAITGRKFTEEDLFIGQDYQGNVYIRSKFEAECRMLEAVKAGLDGTIYRIGLLTGRQSDGKFQYNMDENAYYRKLKSIFHLQCLPEQVMQNALEFTPVDACAQALVAIWKTSRPKSLVYHLYNHKMLTIQEFAKTTATWGTHIKKVSMDEFMDAITSISKTEQGRQALNGIVTDVISGELSFAAAVQVDSSPSIRYLKEVGFEWPEISEAYLWKTFKYIEKVGYFRINSNIS